MAQDDIEKKVELAWLAAFYGAMLTEKQRQVLRLHCEEDLSLGEIAQAAGISRQGVHEMLTRASARLMELEDKLGLARRFRKVEEGLEACRDALRKGRSREAEMLLDELIRLEQEESNGL